MNIDAMRMFARVADLASFSRAAEQLGVAKSHVSASVQQLEGQLGTRLLHRTTRTVRLTEDGQQFLARCNEMLADLEQLGVMFQPAATGLTGRLRIDLPNVIARDVVIPRLPAFLARHPGLEVGISSTDRRVDLVHEGFDCVLRVGTPGESDLVARPLGQMQMANAASPDYLRIHGTPHTLEDLARHRVVHYAASLAASGACWDCWDAHSRRTMSIPMRSSVSVNGTDAYQAAALAGLGIIQAPVLGLRQLLERGALVAIMPDHVAAPMPVTLMYANRRQVAPRVQAVMNWLSEVVTPYLVDAPGELKSANV